jgi:DNA-binding transcriptional MerR regulator
MGAEDPRYSIDELADLGGVSRRTVRYYIQEALIPPPLGVGRGRHYERAHLDALLQVKAMQEAGRSLDEIRRARAGRRPRAALAVADPAPPPALPRSLWRRFELAPGVELHVSGDARLPSAAALEELATWCRVHLGRGEEN